MSPWVTAESLGQYWAHFSCTTQDMENSQIKVDDMLEAIKYQADLKMSDTSEIYTKFYFVYVVL